MKRAALTVERCDNVKVICTLSYDLEKQRLMTCGHEVKFRRVSLDSSQMNHKLQNFHFGSITLKQKINFDKVLAPNILYLSNDKGRENFDSSSTFWF